MSESSDEEETLLLYLYNENQSSKRRNIWVHEIYKHRKAYGMYNNLICRELPLFDDKFYEYFRMSQLQFDHLLQLVGHDIEKTDTHFRESISPKERLCICLRFLATGDSYSTLSFEYRVAKSTISKIVVEVCTAIWKNLQPEYIPPIDTEGWQAISKKFNERWNYPNCFGAIDGKHVMIQAPANSGSMYFNYKGYFSLVLMAMVDADCNFTYVDIGNYGSNSDGGIFGRSTLCQGLEKGLLGIPDAKELHGATVLGKLPYVMVADEAFPLKTNIMRPYPGTKNSYDKRIYNYRHSRARRVSENAFGILANKFRLFNRRLPLKPENAEKVIKTTCVLHNFIRKTSNNQQCLDIDQDQEDLFKTQLESAGGLKALENRRGYHSASNAIDVRDKFKTYFNSEAGSLPWQINKTFGVANV